MKKLIVDAEDFGFNARINKGIIRAHREGVVTSAGIMTTHEGFSEAIDLAKQNPKLDTGVHLDLDRFFDVDHENGVVIPPPHSSPLPLDEIKKEIKCQIDKLKNTGINPSHICSHHSAHLDMQIFPVVCSIAEEYNIRIVRFPEKFYSDKEESNKFKTILAQHNLITIPHFIRGWYFGNIDEEYTIAELVTHPGYGELWREYELTYCCNPELKSYLKESNIQLITFTNLIEDSGKDSGTV